MLQISRQLFKLNTKFGIRTLSTLNFIPPNLATSATKAKEATQSVTEASSEGSNVDGLVYMYKQLPKGPAPATSSGFGPLAWYRQRYFEGENASAAPIVHVILFLFTFGYALEYSHHQATHGHDDGHH